MQKKFDFSTKYKLQYLSKKPLENVSTFVGIGYIPRSVNKRVHITEKTDFNDEINIFLIYISAIYILF